MIVVSDVDIYTTGNTVKFNLEFRTWTGYHEDPTQLHYCLIDQYKNVRVFEQDMTVEHRVGLGKYEIDLVIPSGEGPLALQVSGLLEGTRITTRKLIQRSWVTDRDWDDTCPGDNIAVVGNTMKFICTYRNWEGEITDPISPSVVIYNGNGKELITKENLTGINRISRGIYQYLFRVPNGTSSIVVEFSGVVDNRVVLSRREIPRVWVDGLDFCKVK